MRCKSYKVVVKNLCSIYTNLHFLAFFNKIYNYSKVYENCSTAYSPADFLLLAFIC